jgi:transposase-like protein
MAKNSRVGKSLIAVQNELGTEEQCLAFLEAIRWPEGLRCVECDHDQISKFIAQGRRRVNSKGQEVRSPDRHLYQCLRCAQQFSATTGTLFNDSHLPLQKWMQAVAIMCNAKKGVSARQLWRDLGVSYKTAWYLAHRIREAMMLGNFNDEKMTGTVEVDETYVGGKFDKRRKRERWDKEAVFGMIERETGRVHAKHLPGRSHLNSWQVGSEIDSTVAQSAQIMTDESRLYKNLERRGFNHDIVIHSDKEWVRGDCHTQSIDSFWGLLKRGVIGTFHQISIKHLNRYITEFCFRWNNRENQELFGLTVACLVYGIPLPYAKLIARTSAQSPEASSPEPF